MLSDAALLAIAENLAKLKLPPVLHLKIAVAVVAPLMGGGATAPNGAGPLKPKGNGKAKGASAPKHAARGPNGRFDGKLSGGASSTPAKAGKSRSRKWSHNDQTRNVVDKTLEAAAFLREALSAGPRPATDIDDLAERRGVSPNAIGRAKNELGITARRLDRGAGHFVHLFLPHHRVEETAAEA
jgi:hypothetical protein